MSERRNIVERLRDSDHDDFLPDGSMRCTLCGREPCRCGVPRLYAEASERLRAEAAAEIERLREEVRQASWALGEAAFRAETSETPEVYVKMDPDAPEETKEALAELAHRASKPPYQKYRCGCQGPHGDMCIHHGERAIGTQVIDPDTLEALERTGYTVTKREHVEELRARRAIEGEPVPTPPVTIREAPPLDLEWGPTQTEWIEDVLRDYFTEYPPEEVGINYSAVAARLRDATTPQEGPGPSEPTEDA